MFKKIKLDLFQIKPKKDLISIYKFFKESISKWFDSNNKPKNDFFKTNPICQNISHPLRVAIRGAHFYLFRVVWSFSLGANA